VGDSVPFQVIQDIQIWAGKWDIPRKTLQMSGCDPPLAGLMISWGMKIYPFIYWGYLGIIS
jgi:hypothetical protein